MKRTCDRLHLLLRVLLAAAVLAAPSIGTAAGVVTEQRLTATAAAWRSVLVQEEAVLLADSRAAAGPDTTGASRVAARWPAPSGQQVRGTVPAPYGARAGDRVPVWVTATGAQHAPPLTARDIGLRATTTAVVTSVAVLTVSVAGYLLGVWRLDRTRDRLWAQEWAVVGPRWRALPGEPSTP